MRILGFVLLLFHACIHLLGFLHGIGKVAWTFPDSTTNRAFGFVWLLACLMLLWSAILLILKKAGWYWIAAAAILVSQTPVIRHWQDAASGSMVNLLILGMVALGFFADYFKHQYSRDCEEQRVSPDLQADTLLTEADIAHIPPLVQRYIRYSGAIGKPKVRSFRVSMSGRIRKNNEHPWMPFTSEQFNTIEPPARFFYMDAVMRKLPVAGYHRYLRGKATMDIRLLSAFTVQAMQGHDMDVAETVTFFNDMCCMAPATLIDPRIEWHETEGKKVRASFTVGKITIEAILYFNDKGQLDNFRSDDRLNADTKTRMPWYTPLSEYSEINGHHLAGYGQAFYSYSFGAMCYGNFRIENIEYNPVV